MSGQLVSSDTKPKFAVVEIICMKPIQDSTPIIPEKTSTQLDESSSPSESSESVVEDSVGSSPVLPMGPSDARRRRRKKIWICAAIILVLALAAVAVWFVMKAQSNAQKEEKAYLILEDNDNPADYEQFLADFPKSEYVPEVEARLARIRLMLAKWASIANSGNVKDFEDFIADYSDPIYVRLCEIKIDSLDWVAAQREGTEESLQTYLFNHPDGMYASEASIAQGALRDQAVTEEEYSLVVALCSDFFEGFENQDETVICSNITAKMDKFLNKSNATKADVVSMIKGMFNSHILSCSFVINRDVEIVRSRAADGSSNFIATFTMDQHIERDNQGKTFGSYKCTVHINSQLLISSLVMDEISTIESE